MNGGFRAFLVAVCATIALLLVLTVVLGVEVAR